MRAANEAVVTIWDVPTGQSLRDFPKLPNMNIVALAWGPEGDRVAVGTYLREVKAGGLAELKVVDASTGETIHTLQKSRDGVFSVVFSRDGRRLVSASGRSPVEGPPAYGEVIVWDMATGLDLFRIRAKQQSIFGVTISPDGRWLAYGGDNKAVVIHDLRPASLPAAPRPRPAIR
jgi:WD40 repeat protein